MTDGAPARDSLARLQLPAVALGLIGLAACAVGYFVDANQFFRSWLFAWFFVLGIPAGCLALLMLHHLVGGDWGRIIRRLCEGASLTLPLMLILFLPILAGLHHLYPWVREHPHGNRAVYLNEPFFLIRAAIFLGSWVILGLLLARWGRQETAGTAPQSRRLINLSAAGLVIFFLTMSFATVDWVMSREEHWYSTIFGIMIAVGQGLSAMAFLLALMGLLADKPPFYPHVKPGHFNDLGNLLMTLVILWAYMSFAQYLILWSGNTHEGATWYITRLHEGWGVIAVGLMLLHFLVPFFVLLSRQNKRRVPVLAAIAIGILAIRVVDVFWIVSPSDRILEPPLHVSWIDVAAVVGIGGIWLAAFLWLVKDRPLMAPLLGTGHVAETNYVEGESDSTTEPA